MVKYLFILLLLSHLISCSRSDKNCATCYYVTTSNEASRCGYANSAGPDGFEEINREEIGELCGDDRDVAKEAETTQSYSKCGGQVTIRVRLFCKDN